MAYQVILQFSTSTSWQSTVIRNLCHSEFSHVDFVLPDGNLLGASDHKGGRVIKGNPRGVAIRPPDYQEFGIRRRMIIETDKADAIMAQAMSHLGKPFDRSAIYAFFGSNPWGRDWRAPEKFFCSELATVAFEDGGYWAPRKLLWPKDRVSPTDLYLMFMWDINFVNRDEFWNAIRGLKLGSKEH